MSRELLKEAMPHLKEWALCIRNTIPEYERELAGIASLIERISAALATPEPDAMEVLQKVREEGQFNDGTGKKKPPNSFALLNSEAVALIESYGRRVPRAMLKEIWATSAFCDGMESEKEREAIIDAIVVKYSVQVEG